MKVKITFVSLIFSVFFLVSSINVNAQCAMCRRTAETNIQSNQNNVGKGLNKGILYLLAMPYLIGGIGIFAWYSEKKRKRNSKKITES